MIHDWEPVFDTTDKCKLLQEVLFDSYAKHGDNQFDEDFYDSTMTSYRDIVAEIDNECGDQLYNRDITLEELEGAITRLKAGKAPGPDTSTSPPPPRLVYSIW